MRLARTAALTALMLPLICSVAYAQEPVLEGDPEVVTQGAPGTAETGEPLSDPTVQPGLSDTPGLTDQPGEPVPPVLPDEPPAEGEAATNEDQPPAGCLGSGGIESMIPLIGMVAIIYFLIIRPQQKQQKKLRQMRESIGKGDKVVTTGGIHGVVVNIRDERTVVLKVADGVKLDLDRDAIAGVMSRTGGDES